MQLYRVTDFYGGLLEQEKVLEVDAVEPDTLKIDNQECVYAMVDGSMLFTREEAWKEVKERSPKHGAALEKLFR